MQKIKEINPNLRFNNHSLLYQINLSLQYPINPYPSYCTSKLVKISRRATVNLSKTCKPQTNN